MSQDLIVQSLDPAKVWFPDIKFSDVFDVAEFSRNQYSNNKIINGQDDGAGPGFVGLAGGILSLFAVAAGVIDGSEPLLAASGTAAAVFAASFAVGLRQLGAYKYMQRRDHTAPLSRWHQKALHRKLKKAGYQQWQPLIDSEHPAERDDVYDRFVVRVGVIEQDDQLHYVVTRWHMVCKSRVWTVAWKEVVAVCQGEENLGQAFAHHQLLCEQEEAQAQQQWQLQNSQQKQLVQSAEEQQNQKQMMLEVAATLSKPS